MTSIEWLVEQINKHWDNKNINSDELIKQAKEMHKQEIINTYIIADSESTIEDSEHNALEFYERTFGSKGSDATSSQTEISDEEIHQAKISQCAGSYLFPEQAHLAFVKGAKWYREQLKKINDSEN